MTETWFCPHACLYLDEDNDEHCLVGHPNKEDGCVNKLLNKKWFIQPEACVFDMLNKRGAFSPEDPEEER